ncbi:MAG: hypothetical protein FWB80_01965 [Defluviitaleaceae bacterium]|nr:hypothetical protein [Defluviitaleaceae bacterium]
MMISFLEIAAKVVFKITFTALAKYVVSRIKERAVPISSRKGSDETIN